MIWVVRKKQANKPAAPPVRKGFGSTGLVDVAVFGEVGI
jgi:hypothetical protein